MAEDYTATTGRIDDDGYRVVQIEGPDGYRDRATLRYDVASQWIEQELAILNHPLRDELCEHGLSAALCSGPMHY